MRQHLLIFTFVMGCGMAAMAQSPFDAYKMSQPDLKGTARFMSMGGAFGALGGDLSTLSQNPAGIGVYRRSDFGFTLDLDCQSIKAATQGESTTTDRTKLLLNNIGAVAAIRLDSEIVPNFNIGFTYNKASSFNRKYAGNVPHLQTSLSNYAAGIANGEGVTTGDLTSTPTFNPYYPDDGNYAASWMSILGYQGWLISPSGNPDNPHWDGQMGTNTKGSGYFDMFEKGGIDEYNIALGGNIANTVFWGMDFGITDMRYRMESIWGENLQNAYVNNRSDVEAQTELYNYYETHGTGLNYKIGLIVKPVQALRIGFAIHTPTWYHVDESYYGAIDYSYSANSGIQDPTSYAETNDGYDATNSYRYVSPWKFIASAAGIIGDRMILSADYEWTSYSSMRFKTSSGYWDYGWGYDDWWDDPWYKGATKSLDTNDPYYYNNSDIRDTFTKSSTLRVGAEFRVTPQFSLRAGYCYVSSPIRSKALDGQVPIYTYGTMPQYVMDRSTNYITCGLGYKYQKFYIDAAYVYKHLTSDYHAFPQDEANPTIASPTARITTDNSQIVLSMGFKF